MRPTSTKKTPDSPPFPGALIPLRDHAVALFRTALDAVDPAHLVTAHLARLDNEVIVQLAHGETIRWQAPTTIVGAGKGAARMAAGCEQVLGSKHVSGEVLVANGCSIDLQSVTVTEAGHPLPDARGEAGAHRLLDRITRTQRGGLLCLISGGASSLLVCPAPPITLQDKIDTTRLLLQCGADINELNTVRKHLSVAKGGGLLRHARVPMAGLLISDVVGDDPATIGSGPSVADDTTFTDAWAVLERYHLINRLPAHVVDYLKDGVEGRVADTVKRGSPEASACRNVVIGSNRTALTAAAQAARGQGWEVIVESEPLGGDTTAAARAFGTRLRQQARRGAQGPPQCVLAGGETTVHVKGSGRGGRNQEFALALVDELAGEEIVVLSAGSDGVDGPTDAAGAFVDGETRERARRKGLDPAAMLANNDSYAFFAHLGDHFHCGPTGTNVMDIKIALVPRPSAR